MKKTLTLISAVFVLLVSLNLVLAIAQEQDVTLEYRTTSTSVKAGDEVVVDVVLKNPDRQNVISVRSWMEYNPAHLEGVSVETMESLFTLSAPGEDRFEPESGWVKIGRSNISGGVTEPETVVAKIKFRVKTTSGVTAALKPYDYQVSELGHVSVNIIEQGFPVNVLAHEPEELLIPLNGGGSGGTGAGTPSLATGSSGTTITPISSLIRPTGLKANTGSGIVDLIWEAPLDLNRAGYYVYYGKTSGQYSRRRTVGNVTQTRIEGLPNGETYYFSVTSYLSAGQAGALSNAESDYSDEVGVIVGQPLSSTAPFPGMLEAMLNRLPEQPANGPLAWWILFSAFGLSGTLLFRKSSLTNR
ncbi:MAG: cohesin domain-containing protein [Candidatus Peregrinibacteria bacterium]